MKRTITLKQVGQWSLLIVLAIWGMFAFIILVGEDNPEMPMSLTQFILLKAGALVNISAVGIIAKRCNKRGWLPDLEKLLTEE